MLKGLDPLLGPDLLHILAAMGHGDELVIADANFPAASIARRLVRLDGVDAPRALRAVLSVLPVDTFTPTPAAVMAVVGDPRAVPPPVRDFQPIVDAAAGRPVRSDAERLAFERARAALRWSPLANPDLRQHSRRQGRRIRRMSAPLPPVESATRPLGRTARGDRPRGHATAGRFCGRP
jgi:L-fucose mutarotase